jgi:hypothetical protein
MVEQLDFLRYFQFDYGLHRRAVLALFRDHFPDSKALPEAQLLTLHGDRMLETGYHSSIRLFGKKATRNAKSGNCFLCDVAPKRAKSYSWVTESHKYAILNPSRRNDVYGHYDSMTSKERDTLDYYYADISGRTVRI